MNANIEILFDRRNMIVKVSLKSVGEVWMFTHYLYCSPSAKASHIDLCNIHQASRVDHLYCSSIWAIGAA